jgi:histidinol-phosphate aminotransferase
VGWADSGIERRVSLLGVAADGFDLDHHGDLEVGDGLVDLAVNVRAGTPPPWLLDEITASLTDLAAYPRADAATAAVAARHQCDPGQILLTAGAAEAFVLIARAFRPRHPVVVHPQFTEPESALRSAGHLVDRVILRPEDGFTLDPRAVPADADLVVIGNPTNPTSVLHPADTLRELARPERILVVDEAFMDAVPGEPDSLAGAQLPGLIVIRSLTKTWGLAGLRVGYVVAAPPLIEQLAAVQPHWPLSTPALTAAIACSTPQATAEAHQAAQAFDTQRTHLLTGLTTPPPAAGSATIPLRGADPALTSPAAAGPTPSLQHSADTATAPQHHADTATTPQRSADPATASQHAPGSASTSPYLTNPTPPTKPTAFLNARQVRAYGVPRAPFVLVQVDGADQLRQALRERGFAVRRGDTFPGLGPDWLRIAVRPEPITDAFLKVWWDLLG